MKKRYASIVLPKIGSQIEQKRQKARNFSFFTIISGKQKLTGFKSKLSISDLFKKTESEDTLGSEPKGERKNQKNEF